MTLLAAYSFDEISDPVVDHSGNGRGFALAGSTSSRTAGHTNTGVATAGGTPPSLPQVGVTATRTVMAWAKLTNLARAGVGWLVLWNSPEIGSGSWGVLVNAGTMNIQARNAAGFTRATVTWPTDEAWHHVAGTYDGSSVRIYVDGALAAASALTAPLRVDTDPPRLFQDVAFGTVLDDLRIYDEALDGAAIAVLMATPVTTVDPDPDPDQGQDVEVSATLRFSWSVGNTDLAALRFGRTAAQTPSRADLTAGPAYF